MVSPGPSPLETFWFGPQKGDADCLLRILVDILAKYLVGNFGKMLPKYLAGYSGEIFGGIFWQNIWWDILAKYLAEYFGKISFGIFGQSIFHDILAKYLVRYFGKISQRKFLAK